MFVPKIPPPSKPAPKKLPPYIIDKALLFRLTLGCGFVGHFDSECNGPKGKGGLRDGQEAGDVEEGAVH
ncbi:hypothetical protein KEM48_012077, partial [Puccinia striiformis f. sp. tritici PST-130]